MPVNQQESFRSMVDHVAALFPFYPPELIKRRINHHVRTLIDSRQWSGLIKHAVLPIPAPYSTGTVSCTSGSAVITGTDTAWPTNDKVNTTLSGAITVTGTQWATLTSMANVQVGRYLLIDAGESHEEAVFVLDKTSTQIKADFTLVHDTAETVTMSSLANLQLKLGSNYPIYTIKAVTSATEALLNYEWADASVSSQSYSIGMIYTDLGVRDLRDVLSIVNLSQRIRIKDHFPRENLDYNDPHRASTGTIYCLADYEIDPGGAPLFELYPRPTSQQSLGFIYVQQWANLEEDYDCLPNGIPSHIVVDLSISDAYRYPEHRVLEGGKYFSPDLASQIRQECERALERAQMADDSTRIMRMVWDYQNYPLVGPGGDFWQSHDPASFYGMV